MAEVDGVAVPDAAQRGPVSGDVHAAIDIGTNSIHLVVVRVDGLGGFDVLTTDKEGVRLGAGMGERGELADDAMDRGIATLQRFRQVAETYDANLIAVATSAVREAPNRTTFLDRARDEAQVDVQVIAGTEEARLIHLGVLQALPIFDQRSLVVDIGGGSTELVVGQVGEMLAARSVPVGHIRLTARFFPDGVVSPGAVNDCRSYLRAFLVPATRAIRLMGFDVAAGSSGTVTTIAALLAKQRQNAGVEPGNPTLIRIGELQELILLLIAAESPEERSDRIPGLDLRRADVIVGGALLLEELMVQLGVDTMTASEYALREGVVIDRMHGQDSGFHHLSDIRRDSVLRFADAFEEDRSHVEHATDLALELFDALEAQHRFTLFGRDILEAAGLLHNVGLFISHAAHHKHSYYVIRNSDRLNGFTDREIELVAQVARYHRRSGPKSSHRDYMMLSEADQRRVQILSGVLRIAIALDRTRSRLVPHVSASQDGETITIEPEMIGDASLELYTARERCQLLADALGCEVRVAGPETT